MSLIRLSLRRKRQVTPPPPPPPPPPGGTGFAMSRGPTGSRWGPDALGPDGGLPRVCDSNYGLAGTSATPFAQAGDFYNSVGINVHPYFTYQGWLNTTQYAMWIDRIQELGVIWLRGLGLFSPANKNSGLSGEAGGSQTWLKMCMDANAARSLNSGGPNGLGEKPMFNSVGVLWEREWAIRNFESQNAYTIDPTVSTDGAGLSTLIPILGPPGNYTQTAAHWGGPVIGRNGTTSDPNPLGWSGVDSLTGPNEADNNRQAYFGDVPSERGIRWVARSQKLLRDRLGNTPYLNGESYVDYDTGRIVSGPAKLSQMPTLSFSHFVGPGSAAWTSAGDYTHRQHGEFVSWHQYWSHRPIWEFTFGPWSGNPNGWMDGANAINGKLNAAGGNQIWQRSIPLLQTEQGCYTATPPNGTSGAWSEQYVIPDVHGEHLIHTLVQNYLYGVKRTYIYKLHHEGGETNLTPGMGLCMTNGTRTEAFYAIKNLLGIVRFTQGAATQPITVPHTFTAGADVRWDRSASGQTMKHRLLKLVLQQDDGYLIIFCINNPLWFRGDYQDSRIAGNNHATAAAAARHIPSPQNITFTIPNGFEAVGVAEPAKNPILDPTDGQTYANPNNGQAFAAPGMSGNGFTVSGQTGTLRMCGLTRVVKIRPVTDPAEPPQLLTVTKGPYAAGTSFATAMSGAVPGDVVGLQAGAFNWGTQTPPAGVTIQGATGGSVVNGEFTFTNDNAKLRNLTVRAVTGDTQKSVLEIDADGVEVEWCELDGTPITHTSAPKPSTVFIGGISTQVQNVAITHSKISGPTNGDSQSHAFYIANPGGGTGGVVAGCRIEKCWVYNFPGYGLHFNTNGENLWAYRCVVDDSATRGAAVFSTESGGGPQNNTLDTCVLTAAGGGGVGAIHVVAGTNWASRCLLKTPGVTTPGTGTLNQTANTVVATVTYQNAGTRDYRIPGNSDFQFIPGPTATPVAPIPPSLPIVVPSSGSTAATLRTGSTSGPRLHLKGINIWGLPDDITNNVTVSSKPFWQHEYDNRDAICTTVSGWGANVIRMRMLASDYNGAPSANTDSLTKSQILDRAVAWKVSAQAKNMYICFCPWDGLDGPYAAQFNNTQNLLDISQFFRDLYGRFGDDPRVFYETPNEPNNSGGGPGSLTLAQWQPAIQLLLDQFRQTIGYSGVLVVDPPNWANSGGSTVNTGNPAGYSDATYSALEQYDASRTGMNGQHQLVFAKHDYANNGPYGGTFSDTQWQNGMGGPQIKHLIWENEFGNYNAGGPDPDTNDTWSSNMAAAARDKFSSMQNYVGAAPFLFGPWSDANAMTTSDNSTTTSPWGNTVKNIYFGSSSPPPASLLAPGVVANGSTGQPEGGVIRDGPSLNAGLARVEFDINNDVSVAGAARTAMDATFTSYANAGMKILMLAAGVDYSNTVPTNTQCTNIAGWAARYGPGGAFWTAYTGTDRPISAIEFGNEESYNYKLGPETSTAYADKAKHYAAAFVTTKNAIVAGGSGVKLLAIGDASGSAFFPNWIDNMFIQVSNFSSFVDGWTVHPYGPTHNSKIQRMVDLLAGKGAPSSIPIDITEWGVSTDDGRNLSDNYGYATNLTYAQAATTLLNQSTAMRTNANFGSRVRHFMLYQAHDNQPKGGPSTDREGYFGGRTSTGVDKGNFSTAYRTILAL